MKRFSFGKSKRLISNRQFKAVLGRKLCVSDELLTLYMAENDCGYARLGVSISKSCGGAVVRSRAKRLLREAFRQNQDQILAGFDYLLMVSPGWLKSARGRLTAEKNMLVSSRGTVGQPASARRRQDGPTFEQVKASFLALVAAAKNRVKVKKQ